MQPTTELDLPEVRVSSAPGLIVLHWHSTPTAESVRRVGEVFARARRSRSGRWMMLTLVDSATRAPDSAVRDAMQRDIKTLEPQLAGVSLVIQGEGFGVAAVRAMISGMYLVTRPPYPLKVQPDVPSAFAWLREQWPADVPGPDAESLATLQRSATGFPR